MFPIHVALYLSVSFLVTVAWALLGGQIQDLPEILRDVPGLFTDPERRRMFDFWPFWVWTGWGAIVLVHLAIAIVGPFVNPEKRRLRRIRRHGVSQRRSPPPPVQRATDAIEPAVIHAVIVSANVDESIRPSVAPEDWNALLRGYTKLFARILSAHGGSPLEDTSGLHARFPSPPEAVAFAVDLQREVDHLRSEAGIAPPLGVAVHGVTDTDGRAPTLAARLSEEAGPDEILLTASVADAVSGKIDLADRGVHAAPGAPPQRVLAVRWKGATS